MWSPLKIIQAPRGMGTKSVASFPAGMPSDNKRPPREGNFIPSLSATMTDRCVPPSNLSAKSTCHPCLLVFGDGVRIFWCTWHVIEAMTNWFIQKWHTTPGAETQKKLEMKNKMIKLVRGYVPSTPPADDWRAGYDAFIREYQDSRDEKVARCLNVLNSNGRLTTCDGRRRFAVIVHMAAPILQGRSNHITAW